MGEPATSTLSLSEGRILINFDLWVVLDSPEGIPMGEPATSTLPLSEGRILNNFDLWVVLDSNQ